MDAEGLTATGPFTFAATDHKVAVNAAKTAADDVPSLSLTHILAGETPRKQVPQVDLLIYTHKHVHQNQY